MSKEKNITNQNFKTTEFKVNASNVFLHILTECNLKCAHCYINPEIHGRRALTLETVKQWLKLLIDPKCPTNLVLLGGEPTLHPDLPEMIKEGKKLGFRSIKLDTNGFLFNNVLEKVTPQELDNIAFSIDGASRKTHDLIRGNGSFDILVKGVKQANKKGFNITGCFTGNSLNKKDIPIIPKLAASLGMARLAIHFVGVEGNAKKIENLQITKAEWEEAIAKAKEEAHKNKIWIVFPKIFLNPNEELFCAGKSCRNFTVFPNGRAFRCPMGTDFPINSFEITSKGLKERTGLTEKFLFDLDIPEGCIMQHLTNPNLVERTSKDKPKWKIGCCMIKETFVP